MLTADELAIAHSVVYASLFDYPLTLEQLRQTLPQAVPSTAHLLRAYRCSDALSRMIEYERGFFFPAGRRDLIVERQQREARTRAFLDRHARALRVICAIPFTRMVALSGSVAHLNLERDGDLDLFIVARGRRVWSIAVTAIVAAKLLRCRDVVCVNFVVSDSSLRLEQQDLFTANQVISLRPLVGGDVMNALLAANPFVTQCYPNFTPAPERSAQTPTAARLKRVVEFLLDAPSVPFEALCRWAYGRYLQARQQTWRSPEQVRLNPDCLKLHTQSHRRTILDRFERAMQDALSWQSRAS